MPRPLRTVLLTGATGFLGKVLLEELLRRRTELGIEELLVVVRSKGALRADQRFAREVAGSPCLGRLAPGWERHVTVLEGDLTEPGLGLGAAAAPLLARITHLIHGAAAINFNLPVAEAAQSNITTSLNVLEVARRSPELVRMVAVSTAYVTPHPGHDVPVAEALSPLPRPAAELYRVIRDGGESEAALLAASGHPNTYTLTKTIAEHLLHEGRGAVPLTILRPSIISAARQYPFPGWIDSTAGFGAFVVLIGLGHLRAVIGDARSRLDLVPVDEVSRRIVHACRHDTAPLALRHVTAGAGSSPTVGECAEAIEEFFRTHPVGRRPEIRYLGPAGVPFTMADALYHRLPIALAGARSDQVRRRTRQLGGRLNYLNRAFPYFTSRTFHFRSSHPLDEAFDGLAYVTTVCRGVYRHILKRDESEWPLAGRAHPGHGGDLRWAMTRPAGNAWIRTASILVTKVLRRAVDRVTVDIPSFEAARATVPEGTALVLVPNHRSYLDFVLCSYLAFARPDLGIPIPYIAATMEFGRIPILGRILKAMHAFYLRRGQGREDPDLTRRVRELIEAGQTLEFFIEGQRSRSREFLPPRRGLLRALQATGKPCALLPIAISYDRVPEERAFARELAGHPKPRMRLRSLLAWTVDAWRGRIDLGRIHLACAPPVLLDRESDVHAVSQEVIERLRGATVASTYHLEAYLAHHPECGLDAPALRRLIEARGGRVLESELPVVPGIDPLIARTFCQQFLHLVDDDILAEAGRD